MVQSLIKKPKQEIQVSCVGWSEQVQVAFIWNSAIDEFWEVKIAATLNPAENRLENANHGVKVTAWIAFI